MKLALSLHALLVGIDDYLPPAEDLGFASLGAAVADVLRVERFLRERWGVPAARITKLLSPAGSLGADAAAPTRDNLVAAFRHLRERCRSGEHVWIHYSGHGGRATTVFPDLKGPDGQDETLVPFDVATPGGHHLRDLELGHLVSELVDAGLTVTLVLDSCHAGGGLRQGKAATRRARGSARLDRTPYEAASPVASVADLERTWRRLSGGAYRGRRRTAAGDSGWLPAPRGYVLLAACRAHERAFEDVWDGDGSGGPGGALTHGLLEALERLGPDATWHEVYERVKARVLALTEEGQTPQLEGDGGRPVRGGDLVELESTAAVLDVDRSGRRVLLAAGEAQAVFPGTRFALYPPGTRDFRDLDRRRAEVEVCERAATSSWAVLVAGDASAVEVGSPALRVDRGLARCRGVRWVVGPGARRELLAELRRRLAEEAGGWLEEADGTRPPQFEVVVDRRSCEIRDGSGRPLAGVPTVPPDPAGRSAHAVIRHLLHLCRFYDVLEHVPAEEPGIEGGLSLTLHRLPADFDPAKPPAGLGEPIDASGPRAGEWVCLRLRNASWQPLNVVVLDLQYADWRIEQIHPEDADFRPLDPGREERLYFRTELPAGSRETVEVVKVFGTVEAAHFRGLELPPIGTPPRRGLELSGWDWVTSQLRLTVRA